ncbi:MAG: class I SAM-dependent methyltransferase, partial [Myxococcota bacterium]|nr:class I SAM-dependent methyltransferase [Myxococcota bacterium]
ESTMTAIPVDGRIRLRKGRERRLRGGSPWVYSNELVHPEQGLPAGALVELEDHKGGYVATAAYHPHTLLAARVWTRERGTAIDRPLLARRLAASAARRTVVAAGWAGHRLIHAEADGMPGLVVDRYGELAVIQSTSAFGDRLVEGIADILVGVHGCPLVLLRNDARGRGLEGLPDEVRWLRGSRDGPWEVDEGGVAIRFDPAGGQKTGLYLDMRTTRERIVDWSQGSELLELHAYVGVAGVRAAAAGAARVTLVDSSSAACELARDNGARAGVADQLDVRCADAGDVLKELEPGSYDVVSCDPPSLIQRKKDLRRGTEAFRRLNYLALRAVRPGGLLVTSSCSHHLGWDAFSDLVPSAARRAGRRVVRVFQGGAAPDHPVLPGHPPTDYLRCLAYLVEGEHGGSR